MSSDPNNGALDARFRFPVGIATDASGNLYVGDSGNHTIRKVKPGGVVTTLAGLPGWPGSADGIGRAARFNTPYGIATDASGNLYVADTYNHAIRKVTLGGVVTTVAGSPGVKGKADGTCSNAQFNRPTAVATGASGNVYVADGVATGASGNVYVADGGSWILGENYTQRIRKVTPGCAVTTLAGGRTSGLIEPDGTGSDAASDSVTGLVTDAFGNVYAVDGAARTIRKVTPGGVVTTLAGTPGEDGHRDGIGREARFATPTGIAIDTSGNLYVLDGLLGSTIRKITAIGVVTTLAGSPEMRGSADGTGSAARFSNPLGIATDTSGNLYVADTFNHAIRKVTPGGVVTTVAGSAPTGWEVRRFSAMPMELR